MNDSRPVAIVTGSSRGLGAATVRMLAGRGYNVVINYSKSEEEARKVRKECEASGAETVLCKADVAEDADCCHMVEETVKAWGRVDVLVNNAATTKFNAHGNLEGLSREDFLHIYGINVVGPYQMIRAVAPHMKKAGRGAVVNIASLAGVKAIGSSVAYCASKAALINMTVALARALGPEIRVNAVCPGFIQGEWLKAGMGEEKYQKLKEQLEEKLPLRMTATPEIIAETIRYFIEDAVLVTGETLLLDGGHHLV
ncbi:MAG TPA: SDR family oxidoreductase [Smithellaceae bacterium]|nr:SDR family oxidoreductase [Smithellaceae bacterium]HRS88232.1 SDR family oxidoreductase [Smithellaceae bacterium]HRV25660.1 SDR family oxidoreductase [Smithellaceae bacterium]